MISSSSIVKSLTDKRDPAHLDKKDLPEKLISFLKKNHLLGLLPGIIYRLEKHYQKEKRQETVFITTSHQFSDVVMGEIEKKIGDLEGKNIERKVDSSIIGGFKIKNGYKIVDGSVKTNLKVLKESLLKING